MQNMSNEDITIAIDTGSKMAAILKKIYLDGTSQWYLSPAIQHLLKQYFDAVGCAEC